MQTLERTQKPKKKAHDSQLRLPLGKKDPICEQYRREEKWAVCGSGEVPIKDVHLREIEDVLQSSAEKDGQLGCVITRADKTSLNNINKTGDKEGAGNACILLYQDVLEETMKMAYGKVCGQPYLVRDSNISDETFALAAGELRGILAITPEQFKECHEAARLLFMEKLSAYTYDARKIIDKGAEDPLVVLVGMDLLRYSRALQDPALVSACHIGKPHAIRLTDVRPGFIKEMIAKIEGDELWFLSDMPHSFRYPGNGHGRESPFNGEKPVHERLGKGVVALEVKFRHMSEEDRLAPLKYLSTTSKGIAEIISGRFGLRYINTYMGKQMADLVLSAVGLAMKDIETETRKVRKTESNLIYVVSDADPGEAAAMAATAIRKRLESTGLGSNGILPIEPYVSAVYAKGVFPMNELRAVMALEIMGMNTQEALESMGMQTRHPEILTYTDLLVSAVKIMRPDVLEEAMRLDNKADADAGIRVLSVIREELTKEPSIRDTEDLVFVLRKGEGKKASQKEQDLWKLAKNKGKEFRNRLIDIMSRL